MSLPNARALRSERVAAHEGCPPDERLDRLYRDEGPRLARFFRRRMRQADDVHDFVQESFLRLASFMSRETLVNPAPYLQRIAQNLVFETARRRLRGGAMTTASSELPELSVPPEQEYHLAEEDVMRIYQRALAELPEKTRQVFLLHRVEDLTYREIGVRLGISIPTVQYHFARSLAHIDAALESE